MIRILFFLSLLSFSLFTGSLFAGQDTKNQEISKICFDTLSAFPGAFDKDLLKLSCEKVDLISGCESQIKGIPIYHFDSQTTQQNAKKILVFSLFHGDEKPAGTIARKWMERLVKIDARNSWRIVPVVNPDGVIANTRTNGRGVDINRNLPTKDWDSLAKKNWVAEAKKSDRRYPGDSANSESETHCVLKHIENFNPDFIISIHTPYGMLDFDGPKDKMPKNKFNNLPWKRLGHYPGSLGRYMWHEKNTPVLTVELEGNLFDLKDNYIENLQDISGTLAIKL